MLSSSRWSEAATRPASAGSFAGTITTSSAAVALCEPRTDDTSTGAASAPGATPRAPRSATASTRARQSPSSGLCGWARVTITLAPAERSAPSSLARATMLSRSVTRRSSRSQTKLATAASLARSGARERSTSRAMSVPTIRTSAGGGGSPRGR